MQNIFDNAAFFSEYQKLRQREDNLNDLIVDPALAAQYIKPTFLIVKAKNTTFPSTP